MAVVLTTGFLAVLWQRRHRHKERAGNRQRMPPAAENPIFKPINFEGEDTSASVRDYRQDMLSLVRANPQKHVTSYDRDVTRIDSTPPTPLQSRTAAVYARFASGLAYEEPVPIYSVPHDGTTTLEDSVRVYGHGQPATESYYATPAELPQRDVKLDDDRYVSNV